MATAPQVISFDEYMRTSYSPDREYVDGFVLERSVGQGKHAYTQTVLAGRLNEVLRKQGLIALAEQRVEVAPRRVRIPDVCVVPPLEELVTLTPRLCVEVLSPDDRWSRTNASVRDYQAMGVECIWVIDPYSSRAWIFEDENPPVEVHDGKLVAHRLGIELQLSEVLP